MQHNIVGAYFSLPSWKSGLGPAVSWAGSRTLGPYGVTRGCTAIGATEACASAGTAAGALVRTWDFASAGEATNAATPTADRITFKFDVMFKPHVLNCCPVQ